MAMKVEIVSSEMIKPTSPTTPEHLKDFKICLLDELAPPSYVPVLLFYSSSDFGFVDNDHNTVTNTTLISIKLKESLSKTLTRFFPFAGELRSNISVECNDEGALYVEVKVDIAAAEVAKDPETSLLYQLLPFHPYREKPEKVKVVAGVQASFFKCGSVGIGVCLWHKVADGATVASFLNAWSATANGSNETMAPRLDAARFFPPKGLDLIKQSDLIRDEVVVTKRFEFGGKSLAYLKNKIAEGDPSSCLPPPTRVEAVTALIWKAAMEAAKARTRNHTLPSSILTHAVNIRARMDPPLPDNSIGNLLMLTIAPYMEPHKEAGPHLHHLVAALKKAIARVDRDYVFKLQGEYGVAKAMEPLKEMRELAMGGGVGGGGVEVYTFSSWTRFPLYEVDFGWGRPERVCTITVPVRNCVVLMGTRSGDGVEAWVTLTEEDMGHFECNRELLEFTSDCALDLTKRWG